MALVWSGYRRGVLHGRVGEEHGLQFDGRNLEAIDLDQVLETIDDDDLAVEFDVAEVTGPKPAVRIDHPSGALGLVDIRP